MRGDDKERTPGRRSASDRSAAAAGRDRGRCRSGRCNRRRRPGKASVSDGTTAGQARSLAHPRGFDAGPPVGFVHAFLPGPEGSFTPFFQLPGGGLDVEPSTMTNFKGSRRSPSSPVKPRAATARPTTSSSTCESWRVSTSRRTDPTNRAPSRSFEWTCLIPLGIGTAGPGS